MRKTFAVVLASSLFAACGGGGGGSGGGDDIQIIDSGSGSGSSSACTAAATYEDGSLMTGNATAGTDDMYGDNIGFGVFLNDDTAADGLDISIWKNFAPFNGTFSAQSIALTGAQLDPADCGACIDIETDIVDDDNYGDDYLPTGGTLNLTSVTGKFTGTLMNATFQHVDGMTGDPAADGCTTTVGNFSFDLTISTSAPSNLKARTNRITRLHRGAVSGEAPTRLHMSNIRRI
ncbi:MAG TPA: hypothetical protein VGM39_03930 [Kofleriaceae bacterium]|jgi:hypothetical protein